MDKEMIIIKKSAELNLITANLSLEDCEHFVRSVLEANKEVKQLEEKSKFVRAVEITFGKYKLPLMEEPEKEQSFTCENQTKCCCENPREGLLSDCCNKHNVAPKICCLTTEKEQAKDRNIPDEDGGL